MKSVSLYLCAFCIMIQFIMTSLVVACDIDGRHIVCYLSYLYLFTLECQKRHNLKDKAVWVGQLSARQGFLPKVAKRQQ